MISLMNRNIRLFFRDKANVFFSMLAVLIVIGLYVLFLGDNLKSTLPDMQEADFLIDSWIMSGILAITSITTSLGAYGIMVADKTSKIEKDFMAAPIRYSERIAGYLLSSFIIGSIMSLFTLVLAEMFIVWNGGELLSVFNLLKVMGILLLSVLSSTAMMYFIVALFSSAMAFETASSIIGTLVGFLAGVYIPIGVFPEAVQLLVKLFPISHGAALLRQVMMEEPMQEVFSGAPQDTVQEFELSMGMTYQFGDFILSPMGNVMVLAGTALLFYGLSILMTIRTRD